MSRIFVLGAGASREYKSVKGISVPVDRDFWGSADCIIAEAIQKSDSGPQTENGRHLDYVKIADNLKTWYKISRLQDLNQFGLEKVFSYVEENHPRCLKDFNRLLEWVLFYIIRSIDQNNAPTHYVFAKKMLQPGDSIITFNYDVIIDQTIMDVTQEENSKIQWHPSSGYGLSFSGYINQLTPSRRETILPLENVASDVLIFKLHGSLGWIVGKDDALVLYLTSRNNKVCVAQKGHLSGSFFIVPPLRNKQFPEWIEKLWRDAEERLARADQVFCIGYSFPKTDSKAVNMFKRTCKDKLVNIILPEIGQNEMIRLCRMFDNKPHFVLKTFSQWITSYENIK
jgi:hypothetical protein